MFPVSYIIILPPLTFISSTPCDGKPITATSSTLTSRVALATSISGLCRRHPDVDVVAVNTENSYSQLMDGSDGDVDGDVDSDVDTWWPSWCW